MSEDGLIVAAYATNKANDKEQLQEVINQVETNVAEKTDIILADIAIMKIISGLQSKGKQHTYQIRRVRCVEFDGQ